jgi:predicted RNase H-like nuclease
MKNKIYIGIDLGTWYSNKTRIAILEHNKEKLKIKDIIKEENEINPFEKDKKLITFIENIEKYKKNKLIAIDAPFSLPQYLCSFDNKEKLYNPDNKIKGELANQYIYDNSARLVYLQTGVKPLAPAGDKIGKITARMNHIIKEKVKDLNVLKQPIYDKKMQTATIEVYPRATLSLLKNNEIPKYKGKNFKVKKNIMCKILEENYVDNLGFEKIKTDDDYDAVVCALTGFLIDEYGFICPDKKYFKNSFIYMPNLENIKGQNG